MSRHLGVLAGIALAAVAAYFLWFRGDSGPAQASNQAVNSDWRPTRPDRPPEPGRDQPRRVREPQMPPSAGETHTAAYEQARSQGSARPGEVAFRATVDAFVEYNRSFAEAQARQEGLTVAEVRELTYFGLMVQETQRWPEVEDLLGRALTGDERLAAEELMHTANKEFKAGMRALVARKASEEERWELIQATQERYQREYFALTGMTSELLDDLLAGDITRKGAPIATPPPAELPPGPEYTEPASRPQGHSR
jgi:hypothetical protein